MLYLLTITVMSPLFLKTLAFLIPAMHTRFWVCVFCRSTMHEYFPNDAKQNSVMANDLWSLNCPEHRCLCVPYAFERLFNASSCSGNYKINADVTGTDPDTKKTQLDGWVFFTLTQAVA